MSAPPPGALSTVCALSLFLLFGDARAYCRVGWFSETCYRRKSVETPLFNVSVGSLGIWLCL